MKSKKNVLVSLSIFIVAIFILSMFAQKPSKLEDRVVKLETVVSELQTQISKLQAQVDASKTQSVGYVWKKGSLAPGSSSEQINLNALAQKNGNVNIITLLFRDAKDDIWTDNSFLIYIDGHGGPYNHYTVLAKRIVETYQIEGAGGAMISFRNNSSAEARWTIKVLPLTVSTDW